MIAGYPVRSVANVDLAVGDVPTGGAQTWYVFANRAASSTTFTLSINVSITEGANQRRIGRFYFDGTVIVKDSVRTEMSLLISQLLYFKESQTQCGRLTLSTGVPIPTSDVASSSVLYFTPYKGDRVSLYVPDYGWRNYEFTELAIDISGWTTAKNYDIFLYDNAGTLTLEGLVWSNDTLRATALVLQDGAYVKSGALDRLYLGSIRMSGAGTCADTTFKRFVWNNYNRVDRIIKVFDTTDGWTYNNAAFRSMNNSTANRFEYVAGLAEDAINFVYTLSATNGAAALYFISGIGIDSTSVNSASSSERIYAATSTQISSVSTFSEVALLGYHYLQLLEAALASTITCYGDATYTYPVSGAFGCFHS